MSLHSHKQPVLTTKGGLLYSDGRLVDLPEADHVATSLGFSCAETLVKFLETKEDQELTLKEDLLRKHNWTDLGCGTFRCPVSGSTYVSSVAYKVLVQRIGRDPLGIPEELKDSFYETVKSIENMIDFLKGQKDHLENSSTREQLDLDAFMGKVGEVVIAHNKHIKVLATT